MESCDAAVVRTMGDGGVSAGRFLKGHIPGGTFKIRSLGEPLAKSP